MSTATVADGHGLFYLMGPSGSGKDSLLRALRERLRADHRIVIAHRYITRAADANEASVALTPEEFQRRRALGCLALDWRSHGLHYGIGIEIEQWLARGLTVIVNGSREYLPQAVARYPRLCAVHVRVQPEVLAARLRQRGREAEDAIAGRLARARQAFTVPPGCRLVEIDNSGGLESAVAALAQLVGAAPAAARQA
ncbi:phosphonate metabolism protein/1,5-bisphosphokinase (PRPP-forming) PhnN [Cupriavidus neocaledonicus]|uniref:Ribose 1,5-bisphosphate phosphokinase PhnN n=1 Tax=Cupriavidus neocaledonicus TaxID=1040979 RepID=A0A375HT82_9BURK|nr:phosphonate metabolism protein/1,5-bisphosphokinase (PRPP-forming) PhnN [Cupriavidus neocaledonicus]SOZ38448.1 Phosphonates transport system accessory protein; putative Guanylate kinase (GMP kinase) [Cupriavidus neocaledonicus]SPD59960.1 ribose 1,5-bisphosphokinase [Cupriavidus neocaledonicus]